MKPSVIGTVLALPFLWLQPISAQTRGWVPDDCGLKTSHYLVNSAVLYLRTAANTRFNDQRQRMFNDARTALLSALDKRETENPAVWYYLGRYYYETGDLPGLDSAFGHAQRLAPQCQADIQGWRRRAWVPVLNNGVERIKEGDHDAAITLLHQANAIYDGEPPGFYYLAHIYGTKGDHDSAIVYFGRAIQVARDSANRSNEQAQQLLRDAMFNLASTYQMQNKYDSAVVWYVEFRKIEPGDAQAMTRLADALGQAGREPEALAIYDSVLARKDSMAPIDLFHAGVAMFEAKRLAQATEAFEAGLARNPYYRDALFNLANTYLSMANEADSVKGPAVAARKKELGEKMSPVVERLVQVDPLNERARQLRAAAFQLRDIPDSTLAALEFRQTMPFDVTISQFVPAGSGFDVRGLITNRQDSTATTPPIIFEFLNASGEVVQAITVEPKSIPGGELAPLTLAPVGEGIVAWRYRVES
jgi:tetratricopeptide (TPR) repeat protein